MGHSGTVPSAILATDVPQALSQLTAALAAHKEASSTVEDEGTEEPVVSMANRAQPLIELLTAAAKADRNVMWR